MSTRWAVGTVFALGLATARAQTSSPPADHLAEEVKETAGLVSPRGPGDKAWFRTIRSDKYHPSRLLVRYKSGVKTPARETMQKRAGVSRTKTSFTLVDNLHVIEVPAGTVPQILQKLLDEEDVLYAEPDYEVQFLAIPNDTRFADQWGLRNIGQTVNGDPGTSGADVRATAAWDTWTGDPNFVMASIDGGVELTHPDLAANIWFNPGEVPGNGVDDDANGYIDDRVGWDFVNNDNDPSPFPGDAHGTLTSGVFAAVGNNTVGIAGINWRGKIASFWVDHGSHIIRSVEYCVRNNIRVSNNSYGSAGYAQSEYDAIAAAAEAGHVFVTVAGNIIGDDGDIFPHFPAAYKLPNLINVMATDNDDQVAGSHGATTVDLGAPGLNVLSTTLGGGYAYAGGSSMSGPFVTGTCGLIWSRYPTLDYRQVVGRIIMTARPVPALAGKCVTGGVLDINQALNGDCNNNGTSDLQEIVNGTQGDCNRNGFPDSCEGLPDCDVNGIPDACELGGATGIYQNHNPGVSLSTYTRVDPEINFDWGAGSPMPGLIGIDHFRVLWEGTVVPQYSETYTFEVVAVPGGALRVNGQQVISGFLGGSSQRAGSIALTAGVPCRVAMEYLGLTDSARAQLSWSSPSLPKEIVNFRTNDCNKNAVLDTCELAGQDCNNNGVLDSCDLATGGESVDCDNNGTLDTCELPTQDCNNNGLLDACEILPPETPGIHDCNNNRVPDSCEADCDLDGIPDDCELADSAAFFADFDTSQGSAYALNGSASAVSGAVRLTPAAPNLTGTLIFKTVPPAPVEAFTTSFDFRSGANHSGDGLSFALLDASTQGSNAIFGESGPPMGLTLEFDTFPDSIGASDNHLTLRYQDIDVATYSPAFDLNSGQWHHASVSLQGGAVTVIVTPAGGSAVTAFNAVTIPGFTPRSARFGFGGRNGSVYDEFWVDNVSISASLAHSQDDNANDIPDECETDCDSNGVSDLYQNQASAGHFVEFNATGDTPWTANGSASVESGQMRLTPAADGQTGTLVMPETPGYVDAFEALFRFKIGAGGGIDGADGLSFTMMDAEAFDESALFGEQGPGPQAMTLKFDTFQNAGEPNGNHIALLYNGATLATYTPAFTLNDNAERSVAVRFSNGQITVVLNDTVTVFNNVSVPGYAPVLARFAFGARTGGFNNEHWVDGIFINAHMPALSNCDSNGLPDACEIDCNSNGVPDHCGSISAGVYTATFQSPADTPYRLNASAGIALGQHLELTPSQASRVGTMVFEPVTPGPVESFTASFDFNMGPGDGFSLVLLDAAHWGPDCLFGETGPPHHALSIEFDTFNNGGVDPDGNHVTIWYNGAAVATANAGFLLASGAWNHAVVTLAGGAVTVTWTASLPNHTATILNAVPIPGFTPVSGRFGLGARNGGLFSVHGFDNVAIATDLVQIEMDPDDDGVPDGCDACPGTIQGSSVDDAGCPPLIPGDFDRDGDVDTTDVNAFAACASGPSLPFTPGCEAKDLDADDDTDQSDFSLLQRCYSGANRPASPGCAN